MPRPLQPSRTGVTLVKTFEGLRLVAARLDTGGWTIGYGHTLTAREGARVTEPDAEALLIYDLRHEAERIRPLIYAPLQQNELDALLSFSFNIGDEAFATSEVLKRLNEGDHLGAASAFERWRAADFHGERLIIDGLVRRRAAEKALFLTPSNGHAPVPTPVLRPLLDTQSGDPVDARAARAVRLVAALDGEASLARIDEAADGLSALLRERFKAPETREPPVEAPAPFELPEASDAAPLGEVEPYPGPETAGLSPPAPNNQLEALDDPSLLRSPVADDAVPRDTGAVVSSQSPATPPAAATEPVVATPSRSRGIALVVGLVGLALFALAIASMLGDKATALNLATGLLGAMCLAYASANLTQPKPLPPPE